MRDTDPLTVHEDLETIEEALQELRANVLPLEDSDPEYIIVQIPVRAVSRLTAAVFGGEQPRATETATEA